MLFFIHQLYFLNIFLNRYVITELLQSDLHKIIVSHQPLSSDHIKVFLYQILRGKLRIFFIIIIHFYLFLYMAMVFMETFWSKWTIHYVILLNLIFLNELSRVKKEMERTFFKQNSCGISDSIMLGKPSVNLWYN